MISRVPLTKGQHRTVWGIILGTVALTIIIPSAWGGTRPTAFASKRSPAPIIIGIADAKSGFMSQFDGPVLVGAQLAVKDFNAKGGVLGRQLKIDYCDTASDKSLAARCATQLIASHASFIIPSCDFDYGGPSAIVAQTDKVVSIGCVGSTKFGVQGIGRYAFNLIDPTLVEADDAAGFAYSVKHWKTVYILQDTNLSYTQGWIQEFIKEWTQLAGAKSILGHDTFLQTDTSIPTQITRITSLAQKPDFILMTSNPPGGASALRQMRAAGIQEPVLSDTGMSDDFWYPSVPNISNFYNETYACVNGNDPRAYVNAFYKRFYAVAPSYARKSAKFGIAGYSMIQVAVEALKRAGSTNGTALSSAMEHFTNFPTYMAPITWTAKHHFPIWRAMTFSEAVNGQPKCAGVYKAPTPASTPLG